MDLQEIDKDTGMKKKTYRQVKLLTVGAKRALEPEGLTHSLSYPQIEQLLEANHFQWSVKNYLVGVNFSVHGFKLPGLGGCLSLPQQTLQGTMR